MFRRFLEYKQLWRGGEVIAVDPCHTSQTCPECGHVSPKNRPQQALFSCEQCGYSYHADIVAAQNNLTRGQREGACWPLRRHSRAKGCALRRRSRARG